MRSVMSITAPTNSTSPDSVPDGPATTWTLEVASSAGLHAALVLVHAPTYKVLVPMNLPTKMHSIRARLSHGMTSALIHRHENCEENWEASTTELWEGQGPVWHVHFRSEFYHLCCVDLRRYLSGIEPVP